MFSCARPTRSTLSMWPPLAPLIDVFLVYGLVVLGPIRTLELWGAVLGIQMLAGLIARLRDGAGEPAAAAGDAGTRPADDGQLR